MAERVYVARRKVLRANITRLHNERENFEHLDQQALTKNRATLVKAEEDITDLNEKILLVKYPDTKFTGDDVAL